MRKPTRHVSLPPPPPTTAEALMALAAAVHDLGNGNACTQMGALEALGLVFKDALPHLADAIAASGREISLSLDGVAEAIQDLRRSST